MAEDLVKKAEKTGGRPLLSVVVPCYNERATIGECLARLLAIEDETLGLEIIVVDDASRDGCGEIVREFAKKHPRIFLLTHEVNRGKGAALRTGFARATGDFVAIQDGDLEYDPGDLKKLVAILAEGKADVAFGSRFQGKKGDAGDYFVHRTANKVLTLASNLFTGLKITDMETCYKVFRADVLKKLDLKENRFGIEPEMTAKVAGLGVRVAEAPVSYAARTYGAGKKIGLKDGLRALWCIVKYGKGR